MDTPSPAAEPEFAAFIGMDWADQKHAWSLQAAGSSRIERGQVDNTPEAIEGWVTGLRQRFGSQPMAVAWEQWRGNVIAKLSKYSDWVLYPINPKASSDYRSCFHLSGAKSDPVDGDLLLELITRHRNRLRRLDPDTVETRMVRILSEQRRNLVDQQTAFTSQLRDTLKQIFPQAVPWLDTLHSEMACDFLQRWPTLQSVVRAQVQTVRKFFQQHNSRSPERIEERIEQIAQATPATEDPALLEPGILMIQGLTKLLDQLRASIAEFDAKLKKVAEAHPDFAIMRSFPGAGPVMAARLIGTLGSNRERFGSAEELQCFTGMAPVTVKSGQQEWIHWRWACSQFDRQTIHEWAGHSMKKCEWAREYYDEQRAKGKGHHAAVRALGYKWERILYRCWKDRTTYDEERYLASRRRSASGAGKKSTGAVDIQWKSCGGFSKPTRISA